MKKRTPQTLGELGELAVLKRILALLPNRADVPVGPGDDCAVVRPARHAREDWLLTSDPVIERTHFSGNTPPAAVGRKAVGRVLSDLAAMGGTPAWTLLNAVAPPRTPVAWLLAVCRGALALARRHGLALVGGDLSAGPVREIHAFGVGRLPRGSALTRAAARNGHLLYVTGTLGGSLRGKHLSFDPRVREGAWLRESGFAAAAIDVTDGLVPDLRHVLDRSGVGAELDLDRVPVSADAKAMRDGTPPLEHALYDGEDFELLFTVPPAKAAAFERAWGRRFRLRCTRIGRITGRIGDLVGVAGTGRFRLPRKGYQHFV